MLQKFVYYTGAFDFLIAIGTYVGAFYDPKIDQFVPLVTLGTFLLMSSLLLMWASHDLAERAPIVFWQALCRLSLGAAVLYGVPNGYAHSFEYGVAAFDSSIAIVYILAMMKITSCSFMQLLKCQASPTARGAL